MSACNDFIEFVLDLDGKSFPAMFQHFEKAFREDNGTAIRIVLWTSEFDKLPFHQLLKYIEMNYPIQMKQILHHIIKYGKVTDLFVMQSLAYKQLVFELISQEIEYDYDH